MAYGNCSGREKETPYDHVALSESTIPISLMANECFTQNITLLRNFKSNQALSVSSYLLITVKTKILFLWGEEPLARLQN